MESKKPPSRFARSILMLRSGYAAIEATGAAFVPGKEIKTGVVISRDEARQVEREMQREMVGGHAVAKLQHEPGE